MTEREPEGRTQVPDWQALAREARKELDNLAMVATEVTCLEKRFSNRLDRVLIYPAGCLLFTLVLLAAAVNVISIAKGAAQIFMAIPVLICLWLYGTIRLGGLLPGIRHNVFYRRVEANKNTLYALLVLVSYAAWVYQILADARVSSEP